MSSFPQNGDLFASVTCCAQRINARSFTATQQHEGPGHAGTFAAGMVIAVRVLTNASGRLGAFHVVAFCTPEEVSKFECMSLKSCHVGVGLMWPWRA